MEAFSDEKMYVTKHAKKRQKNKNKLVKDSVCSI